MTGIGEGVEAPETVLEHLFTLVVLVVGITLYATLVGSLSNMISSTNVRQRVCVCGLCVFLLCVFVLYVCMCLLLCVLFSLLRYTDVFTHPLSLTHSLTHFSRIFL